MKIKIVFLVLAITNSIFIVNLENSCNDNNVDQLVSFTISQDNNKIGL